MIENTITIPDLRAMVGQEFVMPNIETIDNSSIIRYAQAISDSHPLYCNEGYTLESEIKECMAPPTFIFDIFPAKSKFGVDGRDVTRISVPGYKLLRGGNEYEFLKPVKSGDTISRKMKITDVYEKESKKIGTITFVLYHITYKNQKQEMVAINQETLMFYK